MFSNVSAILGHPQEGERVAVPTEDQELSPNDAAVILGISRPLVVRRMDPGDLPFRYVGKHRRARLTDVLALKARIGAQRTAMEALAEDAEDLHRRYRDASMVRSGSRSSSVLKKRYCGRHRRCGTRYRGGRTGNTNKERDKSQYIMVLQASFRRRSS